MSRCFTRNVTILAFTIILLEVVFLLTYHYDKMDLQIEMNQNSFQFFKFNSTLRKSSKFKTLKQIYAIDSQLQQLASKFIDHEFIHPKANRSSVQKAVGMKMKNIKEIATVRNVMINVLNPCGDNLGENLKLLVLVHNRASDWPRRQAIRQTYGSELKMNPKTAIYFVVAKGKNQKLLEHEAHVFNDIIQIDFLEHYENCTLKGIAAIRWTALYCPKVKYMFKFDDDSFIRVDQLLVDLDSVSSSDHILGNLRSNEKPIREINNKWYISPLYYPFDSYPANQRGIYLIPGHLTVHLYNAILIEPQTDTIPALPFDDVYNSGILPAKAKIALKNAKFIYLTRNKTDMTTNKVLQNHSVFLNKFSAKDLNQVWELTRKL